MDFLPTLQNALFKVSYDFNITFDENMSQK